VLFDKPIPFAEALQYRAAQAILPADAGSAEIARLGVEIRERALFSARTTNAGYLARMDRLLTAMASPAAQYAAGGMAVDPATFRLRMRAELDKLGYVPDRPGSLQDLGSDARLDLIVDMQLKQAHGYGRHVAAQDPDLLDLWPAQELVRVESRRDEREWRRRWVEAGGALYAGRMVARKDDPVWVAISRFGTPYPPFDYNSGMGLRDIRRDEAEQLGVVKPSTVVQPDTRRFDEDVEVDMPSGISSGLAGALAQAFRVVGDKIVLGAAR